LTPGRAAAKAGDVILSVDQQPVRSPQEVIAAARQDKSKVLLQIMRDGHTQLS